MTTSTETEEAEPATITSNAKPANNLRKSTNGLTAEQKRLLLAAAGQHKNNPEYIERGREQVAEYRQQLQEQLERDLKEEGK